MLNWWIVIIDYFAELRVYYEEVIYITPHDYV